MRRNTPLSIYSVFTFLVLLSKLVFAETPIERADWSKYFDEANAQGTIVVSDERSGDKEALAFNTVRSGKRFSPASTFKIPHTLFALEAGVIRDEFETKGWDGVKRSFPGWNQDQNLRSSMRYSVVWVYEGFAKEIGEQKEREFLKKIQYGNQDSSGKQPFWIEGNLQISAQEQLDF